MGIGNILGSFLGGVISTAVGIDNMIFIMLSLPVISFFVMAGNGIYLKQCELSPDALISPKAINTGEKSEEKAAEKV